MTSSLPWLPLPNEADDARLASLLASSDDNVCWLQEVQALAGFAWSEPRLRKLGKAVRRLFSRPSWPEAAAKAGLLPYRLLILSSSTSVHMQDAITATALRHGIALQTDCVEYVEPEMWLASQDQCQAFDGTLIAIDESGWGLEAGIQSAKEAQHILDSALEKVGRIVNSVISRISPAVMFQTLAQTDESFESSLDLGVVGTVRNLRARFNLGLAERTASTGHMLLDVASLASSRGISNWRAGRYKHIGMFPFAPNALELYADAVARIIASRVGRSKRVLVLDLDNTLWGGVIGDDGLEGIQIAPGNPAGEAHRAVQQMALDARRRGIVLCVASKNTFDIAIDVFHSHPDMILTEGSISLFKINWQDKATSIREMAKTLDLGLDAFVFVDDNPVERMQVRAELPQVAVPELPKEVSDWPHILSLAGYFEQSALTAEDANRGIYYAANAKRDQLREGASDMQSFLESLGMEMQVRPFDAMGRARIAQLVSKSNQFNLTTRRYSEAEIAALEDNPDAITLQIRLKDRFGDNGMISAVVAIPNDGRMHIDLWIMSCRVLSRKVEEATLNVLVEECRKRGFDRLTGTYIPTTRNGIVKNHYSNLGFEGVDSGGRQWQLSIEEFSPFSSPMAIVRE